MKLIDRLKELFNKIIGKNQQYMLEEPNQRYQSQYEQLKTQEEYIPQELPEGEIVPFSNGEVLDANSRDSEVKLKHNLQILIDKAKAEGKIDKFMIIREDDFFPIDMKWQVLSRNTNLEKVHTPLSYELRKAYALREAGIQTHSNLLGLNVQIPLTSEAEEIVQKSDKNIGNFLYPSRFRSTKHFTINTPLEITGSYNLVDTDRDYIVIDNMKEFLKSKYGYSVAYRDAYLDVSHEDLQISDEAVILIKDDNYDRIMSNSEIAKQLSQRKVIRYKGDTHLAIDMVLTEMGVLPSSVGSKYAHYDNELNDILDSSIKKLAKDNNLFFDKSHGGDGETGHFTSYFDDKNQDYEIASRESIEFLAKKFPEQQALFVRYLRDTNVAPNIVEAIGVDKLLEAIEEYNKIAIQNEKIAHQEYDKDRSTITPVMHEQFTKMVSLINEFYKDIPFDSNYDRKKEIETSIQKFFQGNTLEEQQTAAKDIWKLIRPRIVEKIEAKKEYKTQQYNTQDIQSTNHEEELDDNEISR